MREERPQLARRVPGATNAGPASPARCPLSAAMVERLQAAVDAAHAAQAAQAGSPFADLPGASGASDYDLALHQADEDPGSLWAAAPSRPANGNGGAAATEPTTTPGPGGAFPRLWLRSGRAIRRLWR
jgi:hypothetical protein